jgi:hypothetical protein
MARLRIHGAVPVFPQRVFMPYLITNRDSLVYVVLRHLLMNSTDRTFQTEAAVFDGQEFA